MKIILVVTMIVICLIPAVAAESTAPLGNPGMIQGYPRYGGFMQLSPLTADEEQYDSTCRKIDDLEQEIGGRRVVLFTADELGWFIWFRNKTFLSPRQSQLDEQVIALQSLLDKLNER